MACVFLTKWWLKKKSEDFIENEFYTNAPD